METTPLPMALFLQVVRDHGVDTPEVLEAAGHHPKVIDSKARAAANRGYTSYGTVVDRPWLTPKGEAFLAEYGGDRG